MSGWNDARGCFELTSTQAQRWAGRSPRGSRPEMPRHEIERRMRRDGLAFIPRGYFWDVHASLEAVRDSVSDPRPNPPRVKPDV